VNYDQPRQREDGSGWHYTTFNRRIGTFPVGYCADHAPHATEGEARACYRDYELNERLSLDVTLGSWNPCEAPSGCETLTNRAAQIGGWTLWRLCDEHRTKGVVAELYGPLAGDSVHS
jgi:hypothetical protein